MLYYSKDADTSIEKLFYYPFTFGKHLVKGYNDFKFIITSLKSLPLIRGLNTTTIRNIGNIEYLSDGTDIIVRHISWNSVLTSFYYKKSNFISFSTRGNIASVHPAMYAERNEDYFKCDNGFKVVSRKYRGKIYFNFMDMSGHIISDIDFIQVKPFSEYRGMTARGYTPNRKCYMIFDDGSRQEVNEQRINHNKIISESIHNLIREVEEVDRQRRIQRIVRETIERFISNLVK